MSFFGYPGIPSVLISPQQRQATLATPDEDVVAALEAAADALGAPRDVAANATRQAPPRASGPLKPDTLSAVVASLDSRRTRSSWTRATRAWGRSSRCRNRAAPHTLLTQPGGAIGLGLPCATGAAIACPDRRVICLQADGSGMYTVQSLWTQAREQLNVTTDHLQQPQLPHPRDRDGARRRQGAWASRRSG